MVLYDQLIRSPRQTLAIEFNRSGTVIVRAPHRLPLPVIHKFIETKTPWILKHKSLQAIYAAPALSPEQIKAYREHAEDILPRRLYELSKQTGMQYRTVRITNARKRWGSCRADLICLSWRLMLFLSPLDYVMVHSWLMYHQIIQLDLAAFEKHCPSFKSHRTSLRNQILPQ